MVPIVINIAVAAEGVREATLIVTPKANKVAKRALIFSIHITYVQLTPSA